MNNQEKNAAYEKYVDASVALFMEHYSAALTEQVKQNIKTFDAVPVPEELDQKCRKLIRKECAKRKSRLFFKSLGKGLSYVAILMVVLLSMSSALFVTVEAVRIPIINFYIEHGDGYWVITGDGENSVGNPGPLNNVVFDERDPLNGLVPSEYALERYIELNNGTTAMYQNGEGHTLIFTQTMNSNQLTIDTEDAEYTKELDIIGYDAVLVKTKKMKLVWLDSHRAVMCTLIADSLSEEEIISLAEQLAVQYVK